MIFSHTELCFWKHIMLHKSYIKGSIEVEHSWGHKESLLNCTLKKWYRKLINWFILFRDTFCSTEWIAKKFDTPEKRDVLVLKSYISTIMVLSQSWKSANLPAECSDEPIDKMTFIWAAGSNRWIDKSDTFSWHRLNMQS